jgi:hypothetical protein
LARVVQAAQILVAVSAMVEMAVTHHLVPQQHLVVVAAVASKLLDAPEVPAVVADKIAMQIPAPHHKDSKVGVGLLQLDVHLQVVAVVPGALAQ